jgi:DNA-binding MurR/RpiR family transcriptional regulator
MTSVPSYRERINGLRRDGRLRDSGSPHELLSRFASEGTVSLENLQDSVNKAALAQAIRLMGDAQTNYVLGLGGSFPVAAHLTYVLRRLGRRVVRAASRRSQ